MKQSTCPEENTLDILKESISHNSKPVIIEFMAGWSGSCHLTRSGIEQCIRKYSERITYHKTDIDIHRNIFRYFNIHVLPTIQIFFRGDLEAVLSGLFTPEDLDNCISRIIKKTEMHNPVEAKPNNDGSHKNYMLE